MRLNLACGPSLAKRCSRKLRGVYICLMCHESSRMTDNTQPLPSSSMGRVVVDLAPLVIRAQKLIGSAPTQRQIRKLPNK